MKTLCTYLNESYDISEGLLGKFLKQKGISKKDVKQIGVPTFKTLAELGLEIEKKFDIKVHLKFADDETKYIPIVKAIKYESVKGIKAISFCLLFNINEDIGV